MKIGARLFKTGLAVTVTLFVSEWLGIEYPFFAVIATIISMQATVIDSASVGLNRMIGTIVGAVVGIVFVLTVGSNSITGGIGVLITLMILNQVGGASAKTIGAIVFLAIFLESASEVGSYAINRILDTFLGVVIAFLINYFVLPPKVDERIQQKVKEILKLERQLFELLINHYRLGTYNEEIKQIEVELNELIFEVKKLADLHKQEDNYRILTKSDKFNYLQIVSSVERILEHILAIDHAAWDRAEKCKANKPVILTEEVKKLSEVIIQQFRHLEETLFLAAIANNIEAVSEKSCLEQAMIDKNIISEKNIEGLLRFSTVYYSMSEINFKLNQLSRKYS